ncbi:MAG: response regulator [Phycisphaeraceae bacterium]
MTLQDLNTHAVSTMRRILVVDDEPDIRANLTDILGDLGYEVDTAGNGNEALALVERKAYDVALIDLKMPGIDGLELYRRIKKIHSATVVIITTAYAGGDTARAAMAAGAWEIVSKPMDFNMLLPLIEGALTQPAIIIVDDDTDLCDNLWSILHDRRYRVGIAHDIDDAQALIEARDFSIALIDLKLPQGDGTQLLQLIKARQPDARAILISGHRAELDDAVRAATGPSPDAVCYKPIDIESLLTTVRDLTRA